MEFHISRLARDRYKFDQALFSFTGNVIFADFYTARLFAQKINQIRDLVNYPEQTVRAGDINALGMIDEILHLVVQLYRMQISSTAMQDALDWAAQIVPSRDIDSLLLEFAKEFPPTQVYQGKLTLGEYFAGETDGIPHKVAVFEELVMLWLANENPAFQPFSEFFDDRRLRSETAYLKVIRATQEYFATQPKFGPFRQSLIDMLRSPAIEVPNSLFGQLEFIREKWSELLGKYLFRLLTSLDFLREESRLRFIGPGPVEIPVLDRSKLSASDVENFSPDRDWMPRLVMIAKNTFVWLDQLSRQYRRPIQHLDQIPDEELARLASLGFSGLWLIGLWERSHASAEIKKLCGNPDALASAYSLFDYTIASDLGGEDAYWRLKERAWRFGIRLASDMVPNHMGIDSPWVIEHPDWFVQLDYSPFPSYQFNGPNLSRDSRASVYLEDHYYDKTDAAVTFKYVDHRDGRTRHIYHGNDGTSMPWNDTAQLNYLNAEVREAVIQTILQVARRSPIIRFDAAMTLAKKHYQRLWYPEPGTGGAIPSRAEHGLPRWDFDQVFPTEFWRDVVERVQQEAPDTLLLAEAFWMMESYFVRTLGMHRVYNSAFMNLLRNEENEKYRALIKNTLEFDPEILKRYVNFMNNPDERTAIDQFGKGDKYFGICTLMATLPGLPMFGHGQFEGYAEKYGMEFRRALWEEQPDEELVERHRREISPLLHHRELFANVDDFWMFDLEVDGGYANNDVYAYSNGHGGDHALVVFNNRFSSTSGVLRRSAWCSRRQPDGNRSMAQKNLAEALGISRTPGKFTIYREVHSGLEYLIPNSVLVNDGFPVHLDAYSYYVFWQFRQVQDDGLGAYQRLWQTLNGRGVPSIDEALQYLELEPVQRPFREIFNAGRLAYLLETPALSGARALPVHFKDEIKTLATNLFAGAASFSNSKAEVAPLVEQVVQRVNIWLEIQSLTQVMPMPPASKMAQSMQWVEKEFAKDTTRSLSLLAWCFIGDLGRVTEHPFPSQVTQAWLDEWQLLKAIQMALTDLKTPKDQISRVLNTVRLLVAIQDEAVSLPGSDLAEIVPGLLKNDLVQSLLGVNRFKDVLWFNQEGFEDLTWWLTLLPVFASEETEASLTRATTLEKLLVTSPQAVTLQKACLASGYKVEGLLNALQKPAP